MSSSCEVFEKMVEVFNEMTEVSDKWIKKGNKSSAAKMRKATLALDHLGKDFRKLSVAECKGDIVVECKEDDKIKSEYLHEH